MTAKRQRASLRTPRASTIASEPNDAFVPSSRTVIRALATNDPEFQLFGHVWPALDAIAAEIEAQMVALARGEGLDSVEIVRTSREAGAASAIAEVHPRSPQLTIAVDADWLVRVVPPGVGAEGFPEQLRVFRVPAGVPIMINAGIWHAPTQMLGPTDVVTIFRHGTTTVGTDWVELEAPLYGGVGL